MRGQQGLWRIDPDQRRQAGETFVSATDRALEQWRQAREVKR